MIASVSFSVYFTVLIGRSVFMWPEMLDAHWLRPFLPSRWREWRVKGSQIHDKLCVYACAFLPSKRPKTTMMSLVAYVWKHFYQKKEKEEEEIEEEKKKRAPFRNLINGQPKAQCTYALCAANRTDKESRREKKQRNKSNENIANVRQTRTHTDFASLCKYFIQQIKNSREHVAHTMNAE